MLTDMNVNFIKKIRRKIWQADITAKDTTALRNMKCSPKSKKKKDQQYSRFAVGRHCLPITPHIYFTQFMDDTVSEERETAIFMNLVLMSKCAELWVFGDTISAGMKAEIERAERKHMKIRYFTEELEEKE